MTKTTIVVSTLAILTASAALAQDRAPTAVSRRTICVDGWVPAGGHTFAYSPSFRMMACDRHAVAAPEAVTTDTVTPATTEDIDAIIERTCKARWPEDFVLRAACIDRQREAAARLR